MQTTNRPSRRALIAGVSLFVILIIIAFFVWDSSRDEDENSSSNTDGSLSNNVVQGQSYPVTIIIIDDFSRPLKSLVDEIAKAPDTRIGEDFSKAGEQIRTLMQEKGEDGPYMRSGIIDLVNPLKADIAELVQTSPEMNLNGRALQDTNCAVSPEGSAIFVTEGASTFVTEGASVFVTEGASTFVTEGAAMSAQPHGQRVQKEIVELLTLPQAQGLNIQWRVLEADGFVFPELAQKLDAMINEIRAKDSNMRIVVNMSFAIVPCEKVTDIAAYTRLLREFVIEEGGSDLAVFEQVLKALYQEDIFHTRPVGEGTFQSEFCPGGESLAACAEYPPDWEPPVGPDRTLYFVAASGNGIKDENGKPLGVDFPFYPAAWKEVIAVSASDDKDHLAVVTPGARAEYSNAGLIIMAGRWLPDPSNWPQGTVQDWQAGTSFAAPRYSFVVALYLAHPQGVDVGCGVDQLPPPAATYDWLNAPPPPNKVDQNHCSTLKP